MRAITSFALLVPTFPRSADVRPDGASPAMHRPATGIAVVALVALLALAAHATVGNAQGRATIADAAIATPVAANVDVAPTKPPVSERWAADRSADGTRPDAAH